MSGNFAPPVRFADNLQKGVTMNITPWKRDFLISARECGALQFGDFTLRSGRRSPWFFNAGMFNTGHALRALGHAYTDLILHEYRDDCDVLFGPAYKGIPIVCTTAIALTERRSEPIPWCFNRKEVKAHGDGGNLVGAPLEGRVLILDDVITAGGSVEKSIEIITAAGATPTGVCIAIDRDERGTESGRSATTEIAEKFGIPVHAIATADDVIEFLAEGSLPGFEGYADHIREYLAQFRAT